jgi:hypothetical protein
MSGNDKLQKTFADAFGDRFDTVRDYYAVHADSVKIKDVSTFLSELTSELIAGPDQDEFTDQETLANSRIHRRIEARWIKPR